MIVTLPEALEQDVKQRAELLHVTVEQFLEDAIGWYLTVDPELQAELAAWERVGFESLAAFEDSLQ